MRATILFIAMLLVFQYPLISQELNEIDVTEAYQKHYDQAIDYISADQYAEAIASLNQAIALAEEHGLQQAYLQANIDLAETFRKTNNLSQGAALLLSLGQHPEFPLQEVRRMGRIAAIYHQNIANTPKAQWDSVTKYLNPAMAMAIVHDFPPELASLKNEYGYLVGRHRNYQEGLPYHLEAAQIYFENGDKRNYTGVMTKFLNLLIHNTQEYDRIDSISSVVLQEIEGQNWFSVNKELFAVLAYYQGLQGNGLQSQTWKTKSVEATLGHVASLTTKQLDNLRVSFETEKFQNEALANAQALNLQQARNRELVTYLSIVGLLVLLIAWFFIRERRTKRVIDHVNKDLQTANDKYQMLIVESNHRIKNNLQMIISMLEYTGKDMNPENTRALKRMSGKIHTISALHKHLYTDVHNARLDLATYFKEIIALYAELSAKNMQIHEHFDEVSIQSERLVYFGLIFNEMLSNTLEHNKAAQKEVYVSATKHNEAFYFEYRDNSEHPGTVKEGTGSLLIRQLINRIGGQNMEFDPLIGQYKFQFYA